MVVSEAFSAHKIACCCAEVAIPTRSRLRQGQAGQLSFYAKSRPGPVILLRGWKGPISPIKEGKFWGMKRPIGGENMEAR